MLPLMKYSSLISINLSVNNPEISYTWRVQEIYGFFRISLGIATGSVYSYTVKAFDAAGNISTASNVASIVN